MGSVHLKRKLSSARVGDEKKIPLLLVAVGFSLGILAGCLFATSISGNGNAALHTYITEFFLAAQSGTLGLPGILSAAWVVFRWPLFVILLGCTVFCGISIPIIFFLRGFLLSFTVCAFMLVLGKNGVLFAFLLLGIGSLITIPILFLLGTEFLSASAQGERRGDGGLLRRLTQPSKALENLVCLIALLFASVWEAYFVPMIVAGAAHWFVL